MGDVKRLTLRFDDPRFNRRVSERLLVEVEDRFRAVYLDFFLGDHGRGLVG
jgi:hypothetical protein